MSDIIVLATELGLLLKQRQWMLSTTESCTGGGVAAAITDIAGSSAWFDCGFVTYSNAAKMRLLQVPESTLAAYGAVSDETAAAMCQGALANSQATVALSTTGIAGPDGAVPGKPVGTVYFGWAIGDKVTTQRMQFSGDRQAVREQSVVHALQGMLDRLKQD
ncbi:MAG: CinA family protein [Oxalicibacterium faecigallinarum]|uniref:CinA family protein n=1 Tax=Oxalicibacterium faecigallinarum TaxID=573741 RepID=UPI00280925FD|nr:CinA family protein [Oxalicibacterium faecigallinarum]MDQ7968658.1 CinA family protein [Oxalicibacterium faecigallinarum]